jgi:hypothetical protein
MISNCSTNSYFEFPKTRLIREVDYLCKCFNPISCMLVLYIAKIRDGRSIVGREVKVCVIRPSIMKRDKVNVDPIEEGANS